MTMDLPELARALELIGMPSRVVVLGGRADNSWCVERADGGKWEVFWMERGNKIDLVCLDSEADACFQILGRLAYTQLAAKIIGRL